jgi:hypothetical protein
MCTHAVVTEAQFLLSEILSEMCEALDPGHGEEVVIGPVDFGGLVPIGDGLSRDEDQGDAYPIGPNIP